MKNWDEWNISVIFVGSFLIYEIYGLPWKDHLNMGRHKKQVKKQSQQYRGLEIPLIYTHRGSIFICILTDLPLLIQVLRTILMHKIYESVFLFYKLCILTLHCPHLIGIKISLFSMHFFAHIYVHLEYLAIFASF